MKTKPSSNVSISNIYKLNGQVPLGKAIPFGIQHILAMFVSNLTPIILIGTASGLDQAKTALLLQMCMFIAGCNFDSALSCLAHWLRSSHCYGCELYLCNDSYLCWRHLRLWGCCWRCSHRRYHGRNPWASGKILA